MTVFAAVGLAICLTAARVADYLHVTPRFPLFAGEDDAVVRFRYFLLVACSGFIVIGAWIGYVYTLCKRTVGWMLGGMVAGSIAAFSLAHACSPLIGDFSSRETANRGVLALFLLWVLFSAVGARMGQVAVRHK